MILLVFKFSLTDQAGQQKCQLKGWDEPFNTSRDAYNGQLLSQKKKKRKLLL